MKTSSPAHIFHFHILTSFVPTNKHMNVFRLRQETEFVDLLFSMWLPGAGRPICASKWRERKCSPMFRNSSKDYSNPGSLDWESGILLLSYHAPHIKCKLLTLLSDSVLVVLNDLDLVRISYCQNFCIYNEATASTYHHANTNKKT